MCDYLSMLGFKLICVSKMGLWTLWRFLGCNVFQPHGGSCLYCVSRWRHQMETFSALLAFCGGIHRSPVTSPYKGQWRGDLMFSLIRAWINGWVNDREACDLRRHRTHYDATVMRFCYFSPYPLELRSKDVDQPAATKSSQIIPGITVVPRQCLIQLSCCYQFGILQWK